MRTFKLTIDEEELKALINHHHYNVDDRYTIDQSARIHDLTKRLNKRVDDNNEVNENNADSEREKATEAASIEGWG